MYPKGVTAFQLTEGRCPKAIHSDPVGQSSAVEHGPDQMSPPCGACASTLPPLASVHCTQVFRQTMVPEVSATPESDIGGKEEGSERESKGTLRCLPYSEAAFRFDTGLST